MRKMVEMSVKEAKPDADVLVFEKQEELLQSAEKDGCDVAMLDIHMCGINGVELAKRLKKVNPKMNIIFVTGFSEYKGDAMDMKASGYIMKPVTKEKVAAETVVPAQMVENIAKGRLNKFYEEVTLLNQKYEQDNKLTIRQYLQSVDKDLTVTDFKRFGLGY
jgi:two-component SAPR family response regulator